MSMITVGEQHRVCVVVMQRFAAVGIINISACRGYVESLVQAASWVDKNASENLFKHLCYHVSITALICIYLWLGLTLVTSVPFLFRSPSRSAGGVLTILIISGPPEWKS